MAKDGSTIALPADPNDPEDGDVTWEALERGLAEREAKLRASGELLTLDPDVLAKFQATGPGWQTRINAALRAAEV